MFFSKKFSSRTGIIAPKPLTINCRGQLLSLDRPRIMGILNVTPDSFSDGGQFNEVEKAVDHAGDMLEAGADLIDIGGYSSRPGADNISPQEELDRVAPVAEKLLATYPKALLSIDTFRSAVAGPLLEMGAHAINDISAGLLDPLMMETVAKFDAPYFLMHMQGTPQTMQKQPTYENIVEQISAYFVDRVNAAKLAGIKDVIIDPGFGFGKTLKHNYELFKNIENFNILGLPILIGISRKSMVYKKFNTKPSDVTELTAALHMKALDAGTNLLRVHDVRPTQRIIDLWLTLNEKQNF